MMREPGHSFCRWRIPVVEHCCAKFNAQKTADVSELVPRRKLARAGRRRFVQMRPVRPCFFQHASVHSSAPSICF
jgi:hypothetical protein